MSSHSITQMQSSHASLASWEKKFPVAGYGSQSRQPYHAKENLLCAGHSLPGAPLASHAVFLNPFCPSCTHTLIHKEVRGGMGYMGKCEKKLYECVSKSRTRTNFFHFFVPPRALLFSLYHPLLVGESHRCSLSLKEQAWFSLSDGLASCCCLLNWWESDPVCGWGRGGFGKQIILC